MVTQEVELDLAPTALLLRCAQQPLAFAFDGGGCGSWMLGQALLGFRPRATLRVMRSGEACVYDGTEQQWYGEPFELLERFCDVWCGSHDVPTGGWAGGVIVALSYGLRRWVERVPVRAADELGLPVLHAAFYDWGLSYSYARRCYQLASAHRSESEMRDIATQLRILAAAPGPPTAAACVPRVRAEWSKDRYLAAIAAALDYIAAGDVYQVNLAQRFTASVAVAPSALFAAMQRHPVPFAAYVDAGDFVLVSNSPECFLRVHDRHVSTFPVKGTRRRAAERDADRQLVRELECDPKERAEHVMIVDLERNDLGRVCEPGSVRVADFARVQTFPSVHHMVSEVTGQLRPRITLADLLHATFPGGSITGAPKVRAMEIIDELEPEGRGFYTGAIGCVGLDGGAVFNIAIRTVVATPGRFSYHAGGGIVADSVPEREYEESLLKARPFFTALATL